MYIRKSEHEIYEEEYHRVREEKIRKQARRDAELRTRDLQDSALCPLVGGLMDHLQVYKAAAQPDPNQKVVEAEKAIKKSYDDLQKVRKDAFEEGVRHGERLAEAAKYTNEEKG